MVVTETDYLRQLQALLPPGPAWSCDDVSAINKVFSALAAEFANVDTRARRLVDEADPRTVLELLADFERVAGLPDPLVGTADGVQGRRAQLVARLIAVGGQSKAYYIAFCAGLGYRIVITEFSPFYLGRRRMGDPLGGMEWNVVWAVDAPQQSVTSFRVGQSAMGERLESWGNEILEKVLKKLSPAHTLIIFRYGSVLGSDASPFVIDQSHLG